MHENELSDLPSRLFILLYLFALCSFSSSFQIMLMMENYSHTVTSLFFFFVNQNMFVVFLIYKYVLLYSLLVLLSLSSPCIFYYILCLDCSACIYSVYRAVVKFQYKEVYYYHLCIKVKLFCRCVRCCDNA